MRFPASATLHAPDGPLALELRIATSPWDRFRGLMLTMLPATDARPVRGLLLPRCRSVHGFFMLHALDVVYLANDASATRLRVVEVSRMPAWGASVGRRGSHHALELRAGQATALGLHEGDEVELHALTRGQERALRPRRTAAWWPR